MKILHKSLFQVFCFSLKTELIFPVIYNIWCKVLRLSLAKNDLCKNKLKKIKTTQTKEKKQILGVVSTLNEHYTNAFVFVENREKEKESYLLEISGFFFSLLY